MLLGHFCVFGEIPTQSFAHFYVRLFIFLYLNCKSSLYILTAVSHWYMTSKHFLPFHGLSFHLLDGVFEAWKTLILKSSLADFVFCCFCFLLRVYSFNLIFSSTSVLFHIVFPVPSVTAWCTEGTWNLLSEMNEVLSLEWMNKWRSEWTDISSSQSCCSCPIKLPASPFLLLFIFASPCFPYLTKCC